MSEYIKREDAKNAIYRDTPLKAFMNRTIEGADKSCDELCDKILAIPSADVEPVRHGHWIKTKAYDWVDCECSECHEKDYIPMSASDINYWFYRNYCPNCGAKMDGGE